MEGSLTEWFIKNYVGKCAQLCPDSNISRLFDDVINSEELQKAVSAVVDWRLRQSLILTPAQFILAEYIIQFYMFLVTL